MSINNRLYQKLQKYLWEFVYGGIDWCVTTFAVVAWSVGANLETRIILILGFANLLADGFSMSIGAYLSSKAEREQAEKHGKVIDDDKKPLAIGLATYVSFILIGLIPLLIYLINVFTQNIDNLFLWASVLTFIWFAFIWWLKSLITEKSKIISMLETLFLWALAAWVAYYVGDFLEKIIR